ncbi:nitroreductase [Desulfonatronospira thiodismutans ASO3-1]|uniref:Nitroreductase n=1 Tax=Desulfonatronospira thiodismutans ASO3-1 TaxID=555779 RepID=D6SMR6_9BACT|nr:nitroreductase [Desulfonatronospira thiodismutans]EFI35977.1 nitroreductase [Desulfonatronospira thiodismutans ASO3-1]
MQVLETIYNRRSIRKFTQEDVSKEDVRRILDAGRWAPSGLNNQPWRFLVLARGDERKNGLEECTKYSHIVRAANVLITVFLDRQAKYHHEKDCQGAGACVQNMLLAAHALGLGAVWLGEIINQESQVHRVLCTDPEQLELMAVVALGHPDQKGSSQRRDLKELMLEEF